MSEDDDLRRPAARERRFLRWIMMHPGGPPSPVHRYAGVLTIRDGNLVFRGTDLLQGTDCRRTIPLRAITGVGLGLEGQTSRNRRGSFVDGEPMPLVVRHRHDGEETTCYFITNFPGLSRRVDGNRHWRDMLLREMARTRHRYRASEPGPASGRPWAEGEEAPRVAVAA